MAFASVTVPEAVKFLKISPSEVSVPVPPIIKVFPTDAVKVQFVKSTFPETLQLPEPVVIVFPVPAEQLKAPVAFTVGLFAEPVKFTSPVPDSATSSVLENV